MCAHMHLILKQSFCPAPLFYFILQKLVSASIEIIIFLVMQKYLKRTANIKLIHLKHMGIFRCLQDVQHQFFSSQNQRDFIAFSVAYAIP